MDRRQFCDTVTRQLRCRWEAPSVRQELSDHIQDHMDALLSGGMDREEAEEAAVAAMGDPEELGKALDALHSPWPWRISLLCARCCKIALVLAVVLTLQNLMTEDLPSPRFLPTATASSAAQDLLRENWEEEVRATGTVTGGGRLGDYILRPQGEALLVYRPDHTYDDGTVYPGGLRLTFLVKTTHFQPWLDDVDIPWYALSAQDDQGNTYGPEDLGTYPESTGGRLLGHHEFSIYDADPAARRFTFTVAAAGKRLTFTVTLEEGDAST